MFPLKGMLCVLIVVAVSSACAEHTPCEFDGRVGSVTFANTSLYPVKVYVYHADTNLQYPDSKTSWTVEGQQSLTLQLYSTDLHLGSDWGIRLGSSPMKCLGNVSRWNAQDSAFTVTPESFFEDQEAKPKANLRGSRLRSWLPFIL